ncbi:hypothetical protein IWX47DRAFT_352774 [Phyllosticta citricarpa]
MCLFFPLPVHLLDCLLAQALVAIRQGQGERKEKEKKKKIEFRVGNARAVARIFRRLYLPLYKNSGRPSKSSRCRVQKRRCDGSPRGPSFVRRSVRTWLIHGSCVVSSVSRPPRARWPSAVFPPAVEPRPSVFFPCIHPPTIVST